MLFNFFRLDDPFDTFDEAELIQHFRTSNDLRNVLYEPAEWPKELRRCTSYNFKNVSLSKKLIENCTFRNCYFEDCLFIATVFNNVHFHNCRFTNCNFFKAEVSECYLDPKSIRFDKRYKKTAANIGVQFFQQLLENSSRTKQPFFEIDADIKFRQWKRAQLRYDYRTRKIGRAQLVIGYLRSGLYELFCGFGYRPLRFAVWTIILFLTVATINLGLFTGGLTVNGVAVRRPDFVDSVFFTFSVLTVLGFSSIVPVGSAAKLLTVLEALGGVGWMGLFTSLLVKRFLK
jgi:Ion channel/Pentapeptide repeats (8 copies)